MAEQKKKKKQKTEKQKKELWCDKVWALLVKIRAKYRCEYCGKNKFLNSHHIFTRNNHTTRWDMDNGICLCSGCHTMSSKFSAHKTPLEFAEWVMQKRGEEWYYELKRKSHRSWDKDVDRVVDYLKTRKEYEKLIEKG